MFCTGMFIQPDYSGNIQERELCPENSDVFSNPSSLLAGIGPPSPRPPGLLEENKSLYSLIVKN